MLNISQKTYSNFENDKSKPGFSQVEEMAKVLDVSVLEQLINTILFLTCNLLKLPKVSLKIKNR
ncbi:helix-turn-helix transcriptional regulator [Chryseobacterium sp. CFBP8996]|uniref:helix-turn-helix domain-containing protein n=1 Tax=Chryseobacterium sp. CFBP8996 TaxID=3096529 RepID=UPI002A6A592E|nr:helix-turn-helix transcriptional regulator [Chryseobacterium sp. CFBP8996]MDY0932587.1 helix-turn-helix transcriptional regulator [Chryseobacterium sp. CFBP8996]